MDGARLRTIIRRLRRAVTPASDGGLTDADLLRRWVTHRDEAAFEALLWRHAAAVLSVCRRVLGDAHEAEDAAQAAFLTLARKAGSIGRRQAVVAWLYTVAYRTALRARACVSRSVSFPPHDLDALPARPVADPAWRDLRPVLDEEVSRLPEKYSATFVLCHVEGRTNEEAARELGCPVGTVLSRLARARQRLRDRLTRRGVTLGVLAAVLAVETATAAAPSALVLASVRAAALAAAGKGLAGVVSTEVVALSGEVVRAMLLTKVKIAAVVVLGVVLLVGGGGVVSYQTAAGEPGRTPADSAATQKSARTAPADQEKLQALLAQQEKEIRELHERVEALQVSLDAKTRELEKALKQAEVQAERARAAEQEARRQAEAERNARKLAEDKAVRSAAGSGRAGPQPAGAGDATAKEVPNRGVKTDRAAQVDQARDEVELLEVQLGVKKAQLKAARLSVEVAHKGGVSPVEQAALVGQLEVREAELRESEVRLEQAKRRLTKLQGPAESGGDLHRQQVSQRAAELEKKLDALREELKGLRKDLEQAPPGRH